MYHTHQLSSTLYSDHTVIIPEFCFQGCYIAQVCEGYITSEDTKQRSYIFVYRPLIVLYKLYCMIQNVTGLYTKTIDLTASKEMMS